MQAGLRWVSALHGMRDNPFTPVQRAIGMGSSSPAAAGASRDLQTSPVEAGLPPPPIANDLEGHPPVRGTIPTCLGIHSASAPAQPSSDHNISGSIDSGRMLWE
jgi:hypothetical protein